MMRDLESCKVLVTPTSYASNDAALRTTLEAAVGEVVYNTTGRPLNAEELITLIVDVDGYIAGLDAITHDVIHAAKKLKIIARYGVGVDAVDLTTAQQQGIIVTNTPAANSASVAELAIGLMLSLVRHIPEAVYATQSGEWPRLRGALISGKTIGLYGFGSIGKLVAKLLSGFDCRIIAHDPFPDREAANQLGVFLVDKDELLSESDMLSLHCPVLPETEGMVNDRFLNKMKTGAFLINTSRGELVDENALEDALTSGHLKGAALDVFQEQPPPADHPLLVCPQVIVTPHMGAHTNEATNAMGWGALNNCLAVLSGKEPENRVI
jgi:D-3-phosphoglycerate dehydrogenase